MSIAIQVSGLAKTFPDGTRAVDGIDLAIECGEIFGLLGPNGAGKTTTVRIMAGLLQASAGQVLVEGKQMTPAHADARLLRGRLGVCPQENVLWDDLTVGESVKLMGRLYSMPAEEIHARSAALLNELNLERKKDSLVRHLSGGMKRRLNLVLGIVHSPAILFLDEPSAGLDPQTRLLLWDFVRRLATESGKTVLLTTHYMEEADRLCNRVAIMDKGKVLEMDTPEALKRKLGGGDVVTAKVVAPIVAEASRLPSVAQASCLPSHMELLPREAGRYMAQASCLPWLQEITARIAGLEGISDVRSDGASLHFVLPGTVAENAAALQNALSVIGSFGARVEDVHVHRPTLEDVFVRLTGRRLRDEEEETRE